MASGEVLDEEITPSERILAAKLQIGSIRAISRATGIPYSTLQSITSGVSKNPRTKTLERIANALSDLPAARSERGRTFVDDAPQWTEDKLTDLEPPHGATAFQLVYFANNAPRAASTGWRYLDSEAPADYVMDRGINPASIRRVVWNKPRGDWSD